MRSKYLFFYLSFIAFHFGYTQTVKAQSKFNSDSLLHQVKTLSSDSFEGRRTGTPGGVKAQAYIINNFKNLHVQPLIQDYKQAFVFKSQGKEFQGTNILGVITGKTKPEEYIVISAHHDHEGIKNGKIYNGADDDASGVSALFAFAEYFEKNPPQHSVILAAFDAEELGLAGSKYFVAHSIVPLEHIKLNLNMDMISRNDQNQLYVTGTIFNQKLKNVISNFKNTEDISILMGHDGRDGLQNWTYASDHGSFHARKIPFLYFGVEDHEDYHQPTDDFENIHPKFYISAVQTIISIFDILDGLNL